MQGSKKASRQLNYDQDIEDSHYDNFYDDNYDDEDEGPVIHHPPRRSVTLSDFFAPGLLSADDSTDNITAKKDQPNKNVNDNQNINDNNEYGYEEDYDDYDSKKLDQCFLEIEKRYDISSCDQELICDFLRDCNYKLSEFWPSLKDGEFGIAKPKPKPKPQKKQQPAPQQKSSSIKFQTPPKQDTTSASIQKSQNGQKVQNSQNSEPPISSSQEIKPPNQTSKVNLPVRSLSLSSLSKITEQHQCATINISTVKTTISKLKRKLNLVVIGHVDAGKSTLMGHLLYLEGKVEHSKMSSIEKESKRQGKEEDKFAWIMAEDEVERARGVTIDVAMTDFETEHLSITILDAPGHRDFVPNMIAGASQADAALLVIDASNTNFDKGQAKEHLYLCRALGVQSIIVAVNKMDTVSYDKNVFQDVVKQINSFLKNNLGIQPIYTIPTAATIGLNLDKLSTEMSWYNGPTILSAIDSIPPPQISSLLDNPFLLCVSQSIEAGNRSLIVSGRIESGYVCKGDVVKISPGNVSCRITEVRTGSGKTIEFGIAGQIVEILLQTQVSSENVPPGSALSDLSRSIPYSNSFTAKVVTFAMNVPLLKGSDLIFYRHAVDIPLHIVDIICLYNKKKQKKLNPGFVPSNAIAEISFRLDSPIALEKHVESKSFGRFIIRARGETLGFGSILEVLPNVQTSTKVATYSDD